MPSQLLYLFLFLFLLLLLILATEFLYRSLQWTSEQSRKFLHVSGGLMCLSFPFFFKSHWWLLPLAVIAFLLLLITFKRKLLPSVHQTRRYSVGSILFPIPVYGCFLAADISDNMLLFYLPVSLLAISDTAAEIGGNKWGHLSRRFFNGQKTLAGSLCFLATAIPLTFFWQLVVFHWPWTEVWGTGLVIAIVATLSELATLRGWDNLSVPAVVMLLLLV